MASGENFCLESEPVKVIKIPVEFGNGQRERATLRYNQTIREIKNDILQSNNISEPNQYVVVLVGGDHSHTILNDDSLVELYAKNMNSGNKPYLAIKERSIAEERPPSPVNSEKLCIKFKK